MRRGEERILAVGLLAAAPARVAEDVEVRGPEIETSHDADVSGAHVLHMLDAPLDADIDRHRMNCRDVESRGQADRLGKLGYAAIDHSVQRLAPPVVGRNVEPRNGARLVHQLRGLFFQGHAVDQVGCPLFGCQTRVQIGRVPCVLGKCTCRRRCKDKQPCPRDNADHNSRHALIHHVPPCSKSTR